MFKIITIPDDAEFDDFEQLGSRSKYWYTFNGKRHLFKMGRPDTGENWSEKVASELCELLEIPHAAYELAVWRGLKGVLSPNFVPEGGRLVHGNELLAKVSPGYEASRKFRQRQHTLGSVLALIKNIGIVPPIGWANAAGIETAVEVFLGYLMLDAWIANQDRHHENWGLVLDLEKPRIHLAPTFDHASSLGSHETDGNRKNRLITKDEGRGMHRYVERALSAFYLSPADTKAMLTLEVFKKATRTYPRAAKSWLARLEALSPQVTQEIFDLIPESEISPISIEFAQMMLILNRQRLLDFKRDLP
jgi:hypothetical protein